MEVYISRKYRGYNIIIQKMGLRVIIQHMHYTKKNIITSTSKSRHHRLLGIERMNIKLQIN